MSFYLIRSGTLWHGTQLSCDKRQFNCDTKEYFFLGNAQTFLVLPRRVADDQTFLTHRYHHIQATICSLSMHSFSYEEIFHAEHDLHNLHL